MKFLNGWKTVLGFVGTGVTLVVASGGHPAEIASKVGEIAQHTDAILTGAFGVLGVLGVIHKAEKRAAK